VRNLNFLKNVANFFSKFGQLKERHLKYFELFSEKKTSEMTWFFLIEGGGGTIERTILGAKVTMLHLLFDFKNRVGKINS